MEAMVRFVICIITLAVLEAAGAVPLPVIDAYPLASVWLHAFPLTAPQNPAHGVR
jgi:hypothetical protein